MGVRENENKFVPSEAIIYFVSTLPDICVGVAAQNWSVFDAHTRERRKMVPFEAAMYIYVLRVTDGRTYGRL